MNDFLRRKFGIEIVWINLIIIVVVTVIAIYADSLVSEIIRNTQ